MKKAVLALLMVTALGAGSAHAQSKVGSTLGTFTRIEPGARGAALGNAGSALPGGIEAVFYNTGAIGLLDETTVLYSHANWLADINHDYVALGLPIGGNSALFFSVTALGSGDIDVRTVEYPLGTGERYKVSDTALGFGFGKQFTSRFSAGMQANYISEKIWNTAATALTFNLGTTYRLNERGARMGFCLTNLGNRHGFSGQGLAIQYDPDSGTTGNNSALPAEQATDMFPVSSLFRLGLSLPFTVGSSSLLVLVEGLHPNDNSESANLGVEWSLAKLLSLRAGYQTLFQTDSQLGWTFGFGVDGELGRNRYQFGYAWAGHDYLNDTHRLTLAIVF